MNSTTEMRQCTTCKQTKRLEGFGVKKDIYIKHATLAEVRKTYRENHKEHVTGRKKLYSEVNKEVKEAHKIYRETQK